MNMGNNLGMPFNFFGRSTKSNNDETDNSSTSSSDSEEDSSAKGCLDSNLNDKRSNNAYKSSSMKFSSNKKLPMDVVHKIEKDLDLHDTISLVFLLYERQLALNVILTIISAGPNDFSKDLLSKWVHTDPPTWCMSLLEALSVIQNYKILNHLGYNKKEIDSNFHPTKNVTLYLNPVKKMLYLLCEFLNKEQSKELTVRVRHDNNTSYSGISTDYGSSQLEFYLLFWISLGYISIDQEVSLKNLTKHLKHMNLLDKVEEIDNIVKSVNTEKKTVLCNPHFDSSDVYPIKDPENVGLCIIVNMAKFEKNVEKKEDLKHLLPHQPLEDRKGSLKDVKNLKETFTHLKFMVVEKHDVFHYHLVSEIQSIIEANFKKTVHSVLILCILSHGDKGIVYAANSIPVDIQSIKNIISGHKPIEDLLANIPKVIIIEACQGQEPLFVETTPVAQDATDSFNNHNQLNLDGSRQLYLDGSDLNLDGPQHFSPKYADVLTCLAIIEGFAAVRSKKEGTKYIQEFCKCLKEYYKRDHLLDIVTRVHNNLNSKEMHLPTEVPGQGNCRKHNNCACIYMTPEAKHTLRKKLYLTPSAFRVSHQLL